MKKILSIALSVCLISGPAFGALIFDKRKAGGTSAPNDATFITQTSNASLSAEQALASLATGILKNTTTTGVLSIAVAGTDYLASDDFFSSNTFKIPNGTAPTVSATGRLAQDTTDDQLVYGSTPRVLRYEEERCAQILGLSDLDTYIIFGSFNDPVTITSIWCHCTQGSCDTLASFHLEDGSGNTMTHTDPTCALENAVATAQAVTSGGLSAKEILRGALTTAPSPYTDTYSVCVSYTVDRQ